MILIAECKDCGQIVQLIPSYGILRQGKRENCPRDSFFLYSDTLDNHISIAVFKEKYPDIKVKE